MSLKDTVVADMKTAMKAKDKVALEALRGIKAALMLDETSGKDVTEQTEITTVQKLYKQRIDAAKIFNEQKRTDLAEVEVIQAKIIEKYLPVQMTETEVRVVVKETITQLGVSSPSDLGKVMGTLMGKLKGKADGNIISKVVKEELQG